MTCKECNHARHTKIEGYVGCQFWYDELGQSGKSEETFARQNIYPYETGITELAIGWAFPYRRPDSEGDGTATSGLMWNFYTCVPVGDTCSHFKGRES